MLLIWFFSLLKCCIFSLCRIRRTQFHPALFVGRDLRAGEKCAVWLLYVSKAMLNKMSNKLKRNRVARGFPQHLSFSVVCYLPDLLYIYLKGQTEFDMEKRVSPGIIFSSALDLKPQVGSLCIRWHVGSFTQHFTAQYAAVAAPVLPFTVPFRFTLTANWTVETAS